MIVFMLMSLPAVALLVTRIGHFVFFQISEIYVTLQIGSVVTNHDIKSSILCTSKYITLIGRSLR